MICACVDCWGVLLPQLLELNGHPIILFHRRMEQAAWEKALTSITDFSRGILLCTDVAARGLDVDWILQILRVGKLI